MMKKLAIASIILLSAFTISNTTKAYQVEVGSSYTHNDWNGFDTAHQLGIDGTYYFNPVQIRNSPLNEAAFLDRASKISAQGNYANNNGIKNSQYTANIEHFIPDSNFYVGGHISRDKLKISTTSINPRITTFGIETGYLPSSGLLFTLGLIGYDEKHGSDSIDPTIRAKYVTKVNQYDTNFEAYSIFGDLDEYKINTEVYLDKTLNIGADYYKSNLLKRNEFGLSTKKFLSQNVNVAGRVGFGNHYNVYGLQAGYRF